MVHFFTKTIIVVLLLIVFKQSVAQTLVPGDVVIVGYNFKDPDEFSLLPLVDLYAGTEVFITDSGWDSQTSSFRKGEGLIIYTVPTGGIKAGQQIVYPYASGFQTQGLNGFFGLALAGDQLFVFQGSVNAPEFIFGISDFNGGWQNSSEVLTNQNSHLPSELILGSTALALNGYLQAHFDCTYFQLDKASFLLQLSDPSYWIKVPDRVILPLEACNFTSLPLVDFNWNYRFEGQNRLVLTIERPLMKAVVWYIYTKDEEQQLSCTFHNGEYHCDLGLIEAERIFLKPCYNSENKSNKCGEFRLLQRDHYTRQISVLAGNLEGSITVKCEGYSGIQAYYLFDTLGRLVVHDKLFQAHEFTIDGLNIGFYVLKVRVELEWKELKVWVTN